MRPRLPVLVLAAGAASLVLTAGVAGATGADDRPDRSRTGPAAPPTDRPAPPTDRPGSPTDRPGAEAAADRRADPGAGGSAGSGSAGGGNNGTVKIHAGSAEPAPQTRNEPHVCTFHVHAAGFDAGRTLRLTVLSWPPTGDRSAVLSAILPTAADGSGRAPASGSYSLPDGHYRLVVDTGDGGRTRDKHKTFWVDCAAPPPACAENCPSPPPTPSVAPSSPPPAPSTSAGPTPDRLGSAGRPAGGSGNASGEASPVPVAPAAEAGGPTRLAATGVAGLGLLALVGLLLTTVGTVMGRRGRTDPR